MDIKMTRTITLSYDGTGEQYCKNADAVNREYTGEGLENWDTGDATGAYINALDMGHDVDDSMLFADGTRLTFDFDDSFFSYEGSWAHSD